MSRPDTTSTDDVEHKNPYFGASVWRGDHRTTRSATVKDTQNRRVTTIQLQDSNVLATTFTILTTTKTHPVDCANYVTLINVDYLTLSNHILILSCATCCSIHIENINHNKWIQHKQYITAKRNTPFITASLHRLTLGQPVLCVDSVTESISHLSARNYSP